MYSHNQVHIFVRNPTIIDFLHLAPLSTDFTDFVCHISTAVILAVIRGSIVAVAVVQCITNSQLWNNSQYAFTKGQENLKK